MVLLVGKGANGEEVCKKEVEGVEVDCEKLGFVTTQGRNRERKQAKKKKRKKRQEPLLSRSTILSIYLSPYAFT